MTKFAQKVYELISKIPEGRVTTYREIARAMDSKAYRAVGQALKNNPFSPQVPCHRVVASDGSLHGFMGKTDNKSLAQKIALLKKEGLSCQANKVVDFEQKLYCFTF